jgi:hypothetical protein|tara:strand:- start:606 stop:716 length:111 start_codon:yes stop_codon:yes gene_type:complete
MALGQGTAKQAPMGLAAAVAAARLQVEMAALADPGL